MNGFCAPRNQSMTLALIVVSLMLFSPRPLLAQQQQQQGTRPPYDPTTRPKVRAMVEAINQRARELGLVTSSDDDDQAAFVRRKVNAQLSEDFEKLHTINAEKIAVQSAAPSFDYRILSDATADLKSRANRIKYNVTLLQISDKREKVRYDEAPERLPSMLFELSGLINSFLGSPVFRLSSPNDLALRQKASRDLDGIIRLSDTINKITKRSKTSQTGK